MSESEDRTQAASPRRRQLAREQGKVAHSPELTAAVGWIAAVSLLAGCETWLTGSLAALVRSPLVGPAARLEDPGDLGRMVFGAAAAVAPPVAILLGGFAAGATAAHLLQTRGMFAPTLIAPDVARVWRFGQGGGIGAKLERCAWSIAKAMA